MKKIILLFIISIGICEIGKTQQFKTIDELKNHLLKNNATIDPIEGVWDVSHYWDVGFKDIDPRYRNSTPSFNPGFLAPYKIAIIKDFDNDYTAYRVDDFFGNISNIDDKCQSWHFKQTSKEGIYIYDNGAPCKYSYHGKAIIKIDGDLNFSGKFEEKEGSVVSWNNFEITATKISPTISEIRNYKNNH